MITHKHKLTRAQAVSFIKRQPAGTRFAVHIRFDAPLVDNDDEYFPGVGTGYTNLTRKEAIRIAGDMISDDIEERGGRVPVSVCRLNERDNATVWLG